jgi:hypothetical protein
MLDKILMAVIVGLAFIMFGGLCMIPPNIWFTKKFPFLERRSRVFWQRDYTPDEIRRMIDSKKWVAGTGKGADGQRYPVLIEVIKND